MCEYHGADGEKLYFLRSMSRITKIGSTGSNLKCALNTQTLYQDETERAEGRQRIENRDTEKDRQKQAAGLLTTRTGRRSRKRQGRKRPYKAGVVFFVFFFTVNHNNRQQQMWKD